MEWHSPQGNLSREFYQPCESKYWISKKIGMKKFQNGKNWKWVIYSCSRHCPEQEYIGMCRLISILKKNKKRNLFQKLSVVQKISSNKCCREQCLDIGCWPALGLQMLSFFLNRKKLFGQTKNMFFKILPLEGQVCQSYMLCRVLPWFNCIHSQISISSHSKVIANLILKVKAL